MVVIENGEQKGYTLVFPSKRKKLLARDFDFCMRYVTLRILFHIAMTGACVIYRSNERVLDFVAAAILCYVIARLIFTKHIVADVSVGSWKYSLAPAVLWLDHVSMFAMLFVTVLISNSAGALGNLLGSVGMFIEVSVVLVGLLPIWSYFEYVRFKHDSMK